MGCGQDRFFGFIPDVENRQALTPTPILNDRLSSTMAGGNAPSRTDPYLHLAAAALSWGLGMPADCRAPEIWVALAQSPLLAAAMPVRVALA